MSMNNNEIHHQLYQLHRQKNLNQQKKYRVFQNVDVPKDDSTTTTTAPTTEIADETVSKPSEEAEHST